MRYTELTCYEINCFLSQHDLVMLNQGGCHSVSIKDIIKNFSEDEIYECGDFVVKFQLSRY